MKRRADHEPGYVLHTYPYKETSLIVEAFTRRHGRVALLARGARRPRSAVRRGVRAFLRQAEGGGALQAAFRPLARRGLMCGFYLNELILRLLPREDPHEALFDAYAEALARLSAGEGYSAVLRSFEKRLLAELGYAPLFDREAMSGEPIEASSSYVYEPDRGPVRASR